MGHAMIARAVRRDRRVVIAAALAIFAATPFVAVTAPRTAPLESKVALAEMTSADVRAALAAGATTVIVPTGGIEQNGPHMILAKHDWIVTAAAAAIARETGRTLVAPVVSYVPQGAYDPPFGHLRFPGTIGVSNEAFAGVLDGIARSLKAGGFKTIVFIGDHGASQPVQADVAARLSREWSRAGVRVVHLAAYYDDAAQIAKLRAEGLSTETIGQHASVIDTSELMAVHRPGVDLTRFNPSAVEPGTVSGDPRSATPERGATLLDMRIKAAVAALRALPPL